MILICPRWRAGKFEHVKFLIHLHLRVRLHLFKAWVAKLMTLHLHFGKILISCVNFVFHLAVVLMVLNDMRVEFS